MRLLLWGGEEVKEISSFSLQKAGVRERENFLLKIIIHHSVILIKRESAETKPLTFCQRDRADFHSPCREFAQSRVSQFRHDYHLGLDKSLLQGAVLCTGGCLATFLVSTH